MSALVPLSSWVPQKVKFIYSNDGNEDQITRVCHNVDDLYTHFTNTIRKIIRELAESAHNQDENDTQWALTFRGSPLKQGSEVEHLKELVSFFGIQHNAPCLTFYMLPNRSSAKKESSQWPAIVYGVVFREDGTIEGIMERNTDFNDEESEKDDISQHSRTEDVKNTHDSAEETSNHSENSGPVRYPSSVISTDDKKGRKQRKTKKEVSFSDHNDEFENYNIDDNQEDNDNQIIVVDPDSDSYQIETISNSSSNKVSHKNTNGSQRSRQSKKSQKPASKDFQKQIRKIVGDIESNKIPNNSLGVNVIPSLCETRDAADLETVKIIGIYFKSHVYNVLAPSAAPVLSIIMKFLSTFDINFQTKLKDFYYQVRFGSHVISETETVKDLFEGIESDSVPFIQVLKKSRHSNGGKPSKYKQASLTSSQTQQTAVESTLDQSNQEMEKETETSQSDILNEEQDNENQSNEEQNDEAQENEEQSNEEQDNIESVVRESSVPAQPISKENDKTVRDSNENTDTANFEETNKPKQQQDANSSGSETLQKSSQKVSQEKNQGALRPSRKSSQQLKRRINNLLDQLEKQPKRTKILSGRSLYASFSSHTSTQLSPVSNVSRSAKSKSQNDSSLARPFVVSDTQEYAAEDANPILNNAAQESVTTTRGMENASGKEKSNEQSLERSYDADRTNQSEVSENTNNLTTYADSSEPSKNIDFSIALTSISTHPSSINNSTEMALPGGSKPSMANSSFGKDDDSSSTNTIDHKERNLYETPDQSGKKGGKIKEESNDERERHNEHNRWHEGDLRQSEHDLSSDAQSGRVLVEFESDSPYNETEIQTEKNSNGSPLIDVNNTAPKNNTLKNPVASNMGSIDNSNVTPVKSGLKPANGSVQTHGFLAFRSPAKKSVDPVTPLRQPHLTTTPPRHQQKPQVSSEDLSQSSVQQPLVNPTTNNTQTALHFDGSNASQQESQTRSRNKPSSKLSPEESQRQLGSEGYSNSASRNGRRRRMSLSSQSQIRLESQAGATQDEEEEDYKDQSGFKEIFHSTQ